MCCEVFIELLRLSYCCIVLFPYVHCKQYIIYKFYNINSILYIVNYICKNFQKYAKLSEYKL
jgi:hypothetical protein